MQVDNLISIIIPVYNVQEYLSKCVESVINQTYNNLEIIIVDDGSGDQGGKICDYYGRLDNRIQVIHKENGGLSDARNVGLKLVTGTYVMFVDSDDWIEQEMVSHLHCLMETYKADLTVCGYQSIVDGDKLENEEGDRDKIWICEGKDILNAYIQGMPCGISSSVWGQLYKIELLENLEFPQGKTYEDLLYNTIAFSRSKKMVCSNKRYYNYQLKRANSITGSQWTIVKVKDFSILSNYKINYLNEIERQDLGKVTLHFTYFILLDVYVRTKDQKIITYLSKELKKCQRKFIGYSQNKNLTLREKGLMLLAFPSLNFCKCIYTCLKKMFSRIC